MAKNATSGKRASGSDKKGGSAAQDAQRKGGGTKASKGGISKADKKNENSSAKS